MDGAIRTSGPRELEQYRGYWNKPFVPVEQQAVLNTLALEPTVRNPIGFRTNRSKGNPGFVPVTPVLFQ